MSLPGGTDANESRYDTEMIAHIRSARAQAADDQWSIRLTLGEVDALLRAVDDRDDLKRRLVGEWEGDVPEPKTAVEVVTQPKRAMCEVCGNAIRGYVDLGLGYAWEHVGGVFGTAAHTARPRA